MSDIKAALYFEIIRTLSTNSGRDVYARGRRYFLVVAFWNSA